MATDDGYHYERPGLGLPPFEYDGEEDDGSSYEERYYFSGKFFARAEAFKFPPDTLLIHTYFPLPSGYGLYVGLAPEVQENGK